jgi:hypothetical protein
VVLRPLSASQRHALIRAQNVDRERYPDRPAPSLARVKWLEKHSSPYWEEFVKNGHANGHNALPARVKPHLARLEQLDAEKSARWKALSEEIGQKQKEVYAAAKADGVETDLLKAIRDDRVLDRKKGALRAKLDHTKVAELDILARAFVNTGFGDFCKELAQQTRANGRINGAAHEAL